MKKVISVAIAILFVLSLAACSSLKKEEIVGEYELISFSMKDGSINYTEEQLSQLKETGKVATLVIRDDDTATMDIFGSKTEMTYKASSGIFVISGQNAKGKFENGIFTLYDNSATMKFRKVS